MTKNQINIFSFSQRQDSSYIPEWTIAVSIKWVSLDQGYIPSDFSHKILIRVRHYLTGARVAVSSSPDLLGFLSHFAFPHEHSASQLYMFICFQITYFQNRESRNVSSWSKIHFRLLPCPFLGFAFFHFALLLLKEKFPVVIDSWEAMYLTEDAQEHRAQVLIL